MFGLNIDTNLVLILIALLAIIYLFFELRNQKLQLLNQETNISFLETKLNKQKKHNFLPIIEEENSINYKKIINQ